MSHLLNPRIVLLKEGTDTSQGKGQLLSNISACQAVVDIVKTTLGPRGMDKLIQVGNKVTISNDGATVISLLDIVHPAASTLVDIAKSQDEMVGDGTTSVVVLAGELLKNVKPFVEDGVHPQILIKGFKTASAMALKKIDELAVRVDKKDSEKFQELLLRCAKTALNSKLIAKQKDFFGKMAVDAIMHLDQEISLDLNMVGIKRVPGGSTTDSFLVKGVAFKKTFSYAGFEQAPKYFKDPKICLLNVELELKSESSNAEIRIKDPKQYQSIVDAEWKIIYDKLAAIVKSGANIVLSKLPIGDLATQYFADRKIFCAGRVEASDLDRVAKATGGMVQTSLNDLNDDILGRCGTFEERQVGSERFNVFKGCPDSKTTTIILRGGAEQFIAETERSLHDALMIVKRTVENASVVGGGGAIEMELSKHLRDYSQTVDTKQQLIIRSFAKSFEVIPRQIADNAGFDATDIMNDLRTAHHQGSIWCGVDIENEGVCDTLKSFVWEPAHNKRNAIAAACEAACMVLSVDETIKNPKAGNIDDERRINPRG
mmetsp:Transcript_13143/g.32229  ORF Transcript_13143/g.32229 Transcript_13143/m.32229 type:complete len:543 (-) Transcript_13143:104-1732(-)|eukprot:CAMPEP_0114515292 /NCGR_PEP_ID=MMETSP0109-20121206/16652_1 /TAXON_ID=29199 /ORGANISM="Chlorarachnion reptans, Strain CCCM449" /LENGTH=542 /DNA_ID=CAMNT_0001695475 /DNA_START=98 /DNA_END=1726 /DNA_ORIENTATION=-